MSICPFRQNTLDYMDLCFRLQLNNNFIEIMVCGVVFCVAINFSFEYIAWVCEGIFGRAGECMWYCWRTVPCVINERSLYNVHAKKNSPLPIFQSDELHIVITLIEKLISNSIYYQYFPRSPHLLFRHLFCNRRSPNEMSSSKVVNY